MINFIYGYFIINIAIFLIVDLIIVNTKPTNKEETKIGLEWDFNKWQFFLFILFFGLPLFLFTVFKTLQGPRNE